MTWTLFPSRAQPPPLLLLDPAIRWWVLLPISLLTFAVNLLFRYVTILLRSGAAARAKQYPSDVADGELLRRATAFRMYGARLLAPDAYVSRKVYFVGDGQHGGAGSSSSSARDSASRASAREGRNDCAATAAAAAADDEAEAEVTPAAADASTMNGEGVLRRTRPARGLMASFADPSRMSDQLVNMISTVLPQMAMGAWARYFFSGFAVAKIPFPLTSRFRPMLQGGLGFQGVGDAASRFDVTYVSSLSWYVLNLFGNGGLYGLVLDPDGGGGGGDGGDDDDDLDPVARADALVERCNVIAPTHDVNSKLRAEMDAIVTQPYRWAVADAETRIVCAYAQRRARRRRHMASERKKDT